MSTGVARGPDGLWRAAVAVDPARPFVTAYDTEGGRVELSYATFDNWVAKTANLITDGLGAEPGERVVLALPLHWQSIVWLLACWTTGTVPVPTDTGEVGEGDIVVADAARLDAALATGAREVVGASLHPLGAPLSDCPPTVLDYTTEVRGYGDHFPAAVPVDPDATALAGPVRSSGADLVASARARAERWRLAPSDRVAVITSGPESLTSPGPDLVWLLAPVVSAAALVLTSGLGSGDLSARLAMEHVTAFIATTPSRLPALGDARPLS